MNMVPEANKIKPSVSSLLTTSGWFCSKLLYPLTGMNILILKGGSSLCLELFHFENEQSSKKLMSSNRVIRLRIFFSCDHCHMSSQFTGDMFIFLVPIHPSPLLLCSHCHLRLHAVFFFLYWTMYCCWIFI